MEKLIQKKTMISTQYNKSKNKQNILENNLK